MNWKAEAKEVIVEQIAAIYPRGVPEKDEKVILKAFDERFREAVKRRISHGGI